MVGDISIHVSSCTVACLHINSSYVVKTFQNQVGLLARLQK
jgi:hypothetical protein